MDSLASSTGTHGQLFLKVGCTVENQYRCPENLILAIRKAHIVDYSISFLPVPIYPSADSSIAGLLMASFKYVGTDFERDMKQMAENEQVRRWWKITDNMQKSLIHGATGSADGPWWLDVDEKFRFDE